MFLVVFWDEGLGVFRIQDLEVYGKQASSPLVSVGIFVGCLKGGVKDNPKPKPQNERIKR